MLGLSLGLTSPRRRVDSVPTASGSWAIVQSTDDAGELTGTMNLDSGTLTSNGTRILGFRYVTTVPQGATIRPSRIQFTCGGSNTGAHTATIWCEDADDAGTFTVDANNLSSRVKTSASVQWVIPDWTANDRTAAQLTPDLSSIMQPVVNRALFGGSLVFIIQRTAGSNNRNFASFDHVSLQEAVFSAVWEI